MLPLLLASSSVYRRDLLSRLRLPFSCSSPDIDESHRPDESAIELVKRLAEQKARALAASHPGHLIIGSDQVAALEGRIIGKPHTFDKACEQLMAEPDLGVTCCRENIEICRMLPFLRLFRRHMERCGAIGILK